MIANIRNNREQCDDDCPSPPGQHDPDVTYVLGDVYRCEHGYIWLREAVPSRPHGLWFSLSPWMNPWTHLRAAKALRATEEET